MFYQVLDVSSLLNQSITKKKNTIECHNYFQNIFTGDKLTNRI
jgi:hypothetical protein